MQHFDTFFEVNENKKITLKKNKPGTAIKAVEKVPSYRVKKMLSSQVEKEDNDVLLNNLSTFYFSGAFAIRNILFKVPYSGYGRMYSPRKNASLLRLPRVHRHTLCFGIAHDVDIKACYPSLLLEISHILGFKPMIRWEAHVKNPEILYHIATSKDNGKGLLFTLIFGGNIRNTTEPREALNYVIGLEEELVFF